MNVKEYNGWTNYETWLVKLWIDNDEGASGYWTEAAEDALRAGFSDDESETGAVSRLAGLLESETKENAPEQVAGHASVYTDLLNAALSEVNWHEIANSMIQDAKANLAEA